MILFTTILAIAVKKSYSAGLAIYAAIIIYAATNAYDISDSW